MPYDHAIRSMQDSLAALQNKSIPVAVFCRTWRAQDPLLADLPPQYAQVIEDLLGRLETSSLFAEESCSFSHGDLHANLAVWLDKAQRMLAARLPDR